MNRFSRIALKTLLWILASVIFLVLLVLILIQIPAVQNYAKNKAVGYLQGKIKTKVQINRLSVEFPKMIVLEGVYFADQKGDTLLAGDKLKVDIAMFELLHSKVVVNEINLKGITANIRRGPDSVFNYGYILKALMGDQKKVPQKTDTSSTLKFSLNKIVLDRISIKYNDAISGNNIRFILNHFDTRIKDFNMDKMKFNIPQITLAGFDARIIQTPSGRASLATQADTASTPINLNLTLGKIDLSKIHVDYKGKEMNTTVSLGRLLFDVDKIDLKNQNVKLNSIELSGTKAYLGLTKPENVKKAVVKVIRKLDTIMAAPASGKPWSLGLGKLTLANNDIQFDNQAQPTQVKGLDYMHMDVHHLNGEMEDLQYNAKVISGRINSLSLSERSGLALKKFHTTFLYGEKESYLNDLYLETPQTRIQKQIRLSYPSVAAISKDLGALRVNADVVDSKIGLKDILILMPEMASMEPFKHAPNAVFKVSGRVLGQVNDLDIQRLEVSGLSHTHISASGHIKGLPTLSRVYLDVKVAGLQTNKADIAILAPPGSIPSSVNLPSSMDLHGTFKGGMSSFNTNLVLRSSDGAADMVAAIKLGPGKNQITYSADIKAKDLNVGKLTGQIKNIGMVSFSLKANGSGYDPKTLKTNFSGTMSKADLRGYTYQGLVFNGTANQGSIATAARLKDPNLSFSMNLKADMNKKYPSVQLNLNLDSANIQKLGFSKTPMRVHGLLVARVPTADLNYLNGKIEVTDLLLINGDQQIKMDTISIVSTANADSSTLKLKSQLITARIAGKYKLMEIGDAVQDNLNKYFSTAQNTTKPTYSPARFSFNAVITKTPVMVQFLPSLKHLDPVTLSGSFDSQKGKLLLSGSAPRIIYGTTTISALSLTAGTSNSALNYAITLNEVKASQIDLINTSITGKAQNNTLSTSIQVLDAKKKERYRIAGMLTRAGAGYQFSLLPEGLMLDYNQWTASAGNSIQFGAAGLLAKDFTISNAGQTLSIATSPPQANGPLKINFTNFKIETLTRLAQQNSLLVGGVINGSAVVKNLDKTALFNTDLRINDFNFRGDTLGNVALKLNNQSPNMLAANISVSGKGNQVNLDGTYDTGKASFDLNLNLVQLNLKSIEGFTFGNLKQAGGSLNGQLKISGTTAAPVIRGDINFNNAAFNIAKINSYYRAPNEKLRFNSDGILFDNFTLIDSAGNKAMVNGTVYTTDYSRYLFGLDITTNNFRVYNASQADNKLYYGQLYLDSRISIRGDMNKPIIDGKITVNEKTKMTIVIPQDDAGIQDRKGVVEFVNKKAPKLDSIIKSRLDSLKKSDITGMDVSANITVDKNAEFTIVVDERNGDVVHLKGDAQLNLGIDVSGKTNLTGTYTVNSGSYDLSYATVKRKFLIKQGSTITWQGDPTLAQLNVTAIYLAKVPPIDLVDNQLTTETERTMYKTKLPFNVDLMLQHELMRPDITFNIVLPDSTYNVTTDVVNTVNAKLDQLRQDPNELNKQVFAVLLLNHFVGENPFQSAAGGQGLQGTVRNSVSSLLSDQLNNLAGNLIQGVDINFALQSGTDYSSGTATNRTDLNVGLSKHFLNDRLTVSVGNNFNLEGQQSNEKATNIAGDVSVNYKLTKDGRYMIRAYRRDQFIVIQGQVIETGVGFAITVDYNKFSQLLKGKSAEEKAMKQKQKQQDKQQKQQASK